MFRVLRDSGNSPLESGHRVRLARAQGANLRSPQPATTPAHGANPRHAAVCTRSVKRNSHALDGSSRLTCHRGRATLFLEFPGLARHSAQAMRPQSNWPRATEPCVAQSENRREARFESRYLRTLCTRCIRAGYGSLSRQHRRQPFLGAQRMRPLALPPAHRTLLPSSPLRQKPLQPPGRSGYCPGARHNRQRLCIEGHTIPELGPPTLWTPDE